MKHVRFSVSVPATSANLGPGFDAVGMALALRVRAEVESSSRFELRFEPGPDAPSHDGFEAAILRAMRRMTPELPRVRVRVTNGIPLGKGLGSSAAATVLGLSVAARARNIPLRRANLARLACELEGHPDNALPAVFGSVVIAASSDPRAYVRLRAPRELRALVVVPSICLSTPASRALLPERYERADVVFTAQRAALLGAALASGSWNELGEAMRDRVHQPYRVPQIPGMAEALALRDGALIGSALSGAGPAMIALLRPRGAWPALARRLEACFERAGIAARSLPLQLCARGLLVAKA
ncbi:MAG: homoserine kinase [Candidatus Eremiobacteraeota bacterium]|nr:homoserine kinase [Candidatus Eremiobacteraeota bacterium]